MKRDQYVIVGPRRHGHGPIRATYEHRSNVQEAARVLDELGIAYSIQNIAMTNPFGDDYIAWELTVTGLPVTAIPLPEP